MKIKRTEKMHDKVISSELFDVESEQDGIIKFKGVDKYIPVNSLRKTFYIFGGGEVTWERV